MAFLLRAITASATGRAIVREQRLEGDRLTIGRDPASDIVLDDLAAALQHALLHRIGARRLAVTAVAGLPFTLDGRLAEQGEIDVAVGAELRLAGYRLTFAAVSGSDDIAILLEPVDLSRSPRADAFSLKGRLVSMRLLSWAVALTIVALFLAWPIASALWSNGPHVATRSWSAGPLSAAHATLAGNCAACHDRPFVPVRDASCQGCHKTTHDHADPARLARALAPGDWAGRFSLSVSHAFGRTEGRCASCHIEHQGAQPPPPDQRACADCHADLRAKLPDTRLPDASDFARAHPQFTPAIQLRAGPHPLFRRIALDADPKEQTGLKFSHALHVSAASGVARMAQSLRQVAAGKGLDCAGCHMPDPNGAGFVPLTMETACQSCHTLSFAAAGSAPRTLRHGDAAEARAALTDYFAAHGAAAPSVAGLVRRRPGDFAAMTVPLPAPGAGAGAQAVRALFAPGGACVDCHTVVAPKAPGGLDYDVAPVTLPRHYLVNGWFDHRAHRTETCASCHAADKSTDAADVLQPRIAECRSCHAGEWATAAAPVQSSCAMCHVYHRDPGLPASADRRRVSAAEGLTQRVAR